MHRLIRLRRENLPDGIRAVGWIAVSSVIIWVSNSIGPKQRASAARMALRSLGIRPERAVVAVPVALGAEAVRRHPAVAALTAMAVTFAGGLIIGMVGPSSPAPSRAPLASAPIIRHRPRRQQRVVVTAPSPSMSTTPVYAPVVMAHTSPPPSTAASPRQSLSAPTSAPSASASPSPSPGNRDVDHGCLLDILTLLGLNVCQASP